jgi:hypothetical protein
LVERFAQFRKEMIAQGWSGPEIRATLATIYKDIAGLAPGGAS